MAETILITGVAKRLGYQLAQHYLKQDKQVIGTYRSERDGVTALKAMGAQLYQVDFYQSAEIDSFIEQVKSTTQSLRAIIHNASDWLPDQCDLPPEQVMSRLMQVHVTAPYQLNLGLQSLLESDPSPFQDIIHIGDDVTRKGSQKHIAYAASKAALENMTLSFAAKLGPKVKVNSLAPALLKFNPGDSPAYQDKVLKKALIQREAGFEEVTRAMDYLLSSEFVTGTRLVVNGGRHLKE